MRFILAIMLAAAGSADAVPVTVDADDFADGTVLTNAFADLTLTMNGTSRTVISRDGFSTFNGTNLATTGSNVFGYTPVAPPNNDGKSWDEDVYGLLRVDFSSPVAYVQIDLLFDDDDEGGIWAYNTAGMLLGSAFGAGDGRGPTPFATVSVARSVADIDYVLAGGLRSEGHFLDHFVYDAQPTVATAPPASALWFLVGFACLVRTAAGRRTLA